MNKPSTRKCDLPSWEMLSLHEIYPQYKLIFLPKLTYNLHQIITASNLAQLISFGHSQISNTQRINYDNLLQYLIPLKFIVLFSQS